MTEDFRAETGSDRPPARHRGRDDQPAPPPGPTLASGLPPWDLLPPTEFVQRPRGRL
jgi:hypothetical protein